MEKRPLYRLSVAQYEKMIQHAILGKYDKIELIRGEMLCKASKSDAHISTSLRLNMNVPKLTHDLALLSVHSPIRLADSVPEPDFSLLELKSDYYKSGKPTPEDTLLVVKIADNTLEFDREVKGPLYAENGIAEYWIVNLIDRCIEVYRDSRRDGTYATTQTFKAGDSITLLNLQAVMVAVADILP